MEKFFTNQYLPVLESIVKYLDDENLEILSRVSRSIHDSILDIPTCKNKIRCWGLMRVISRYLTEWDNMGRQLVGPRGNLFRLFENSRINNGFIEVYADIDFPDTDNEHGIDHSTYRNIYNALPDQQDVKSDLCLETEHRVASVAKLNITILQHGDIMGSIVKLSERCRVQYHAIVCWQGMRCIIKYSDCPRLMFVFKYDSYIGLLEYTIRDSISGNII